MDQKFKEYLLDKNMSQSTVKSYLCAVEQYQKRYQKLDSRSLREHKTFLIEHYKPQTVNLKICALNNYLQYAEEKEYHLSTVRTQQKPFLENVISEADYLYFKNCLKRDNELYWYFVVRFLAATGARVSELLQVKIEHIRIGYLDLYSKGGKIRRIYIPVSLRKELLEWLKENGRTSGFLFLNRSGNRITTRGISYQLKHYAEKYGLDSSVIYPHSFRHRFAKSFLERYSDLSMLADLMGHESIETTRIYLRRTSSEQQAIVDKIIDW